MNLQSYEKENTTQEEPYRKYFGIPNRIAGNSP